MNFVPKDKDISNPKLLTLLKKLKSSDKAAAPALLNQIAEEICMHARFLMAVRVSPIALTSASALTGGAGGAQVDFAVLSDNAGNKYYPLFTDRNELRKWQLSTQPQTTVVQFDECAQIVLDDKASKGFVINPFSDNFPVPAELCKIWLDKKQIMQTGHAECRLEKDAEVFISDYENQPEELVAAICKAAENSENITAVWLRLMTTDGENSHLAVVEAAGDLNAALDAVGEAAKPFIGSMNINVVGADSAFGKKATEDLEPIYKA